MTAIYDLLFTMVLYLQINNRPYFKLLSQKILTNALAGWSDSRKSTSVNKTSIVTCQPYLFGGRKHSSRIVYYKFLMKLSLFGSGIRRHYVYIVSIACHTDS